MTGTIDTVSETNWDEIEPILEDVWQPDVFETAMGTEEIPLQQFAIGPDSNRPGFE